MVSTCQALSAVIADTCPIYFFLPLMKLYLLTLMEQIDHVGLSINITVFSFSQRFYLVLFVCKIVENCNLSIKIQLIIKCHINKIV